MWKVLNFFRSCPRTITFPLLGSFNSSNKLQAYIFVTVDIKSNREIYSRSRKLLYNYQSDFCKNHSTDFCFSFLNDKMLKSSDQSFITGTIRIDLQKAFDTIDHDTNGFSKYSVNLFRSCLINRTF